MQETYDGNESIAAGSLELKNLTCRYVSGSVLTRWIGRKPKNNGEVISRLSLDIPPKAIVAILGPSGSGKSTLLRALGLQESDTHSALRANTELKVEGECNGQKIHSLRPLQEYASRHFELSDEPLRGRRLSEIRDMIAYTESSDKRSRGFLFTTHYMSASLLKAANRVLIMDDPPLFGHSYDPDILKRLEMYLKDAEADEARSRVPYADIAPDEEALGHASSISELVSARYADEIRKGLISEEIIRKIYEEQVHSFDERKGGIRKWVPALSYRMTRDVISRTLKLKR